MKCQRFVIIGCGSSYHAGLAIRQLMEELTDVPVVVEVASDFLDRKPTINRSDICIFLSQSGTNNNNIITAL